MDEKKLQAGDLDRTVDFLKLGTHLNTKGEKAGSSYGPHAMGVFAYFEPGTGSESPEADRETAFQTDTFVVRHRADIDPSMRIRFEGVEYDIINVSPGKQRGQWTLIKAQKRN